MLRRFFNEGKRVDDGRFAQCSEAVRQYVERLREQHRRHGRSARAYRLELHALSMVRALDELEQSIYCAQKLCSGIAGVQESELPEEMRDEYHRHLYFYKNAFIRIFATLDKLGYFMNEAFELRTEKSKPKYSYFTVLRQLRAVGKHPRLEAALTACKLEFHEPMQRLRKKRNVEVHLINAEVLDDLQAMEREYWESQRIENLKANMDDLRSGWEMVSRSMHLVFAYAGEHAKPSGSKPKNG